MYKHGIKDETSFHDPMWEREEDKGNAGAMRKEESFFRVSDDNGNAYDSCIEWEIRNIRSTNQGGNVKNKQRQYKSSV